jgi:TrmH family RNA methyltransferase
MPEFSVILVEPLYGGNIGSVARLMMNFGLKDLVLVNPPEIGSEARMMAVHALGLMENARVVDDFSKLKDDYDYLAAMTAVVATDSNSTRTPISPEDLSAAFDTNAKVGLVFGREDHGLSNDEIKLCDIIVTIPTHYEYRSMNLSHSVAVVLYELMRQEMKKQTEPLKKMRKVEKIEKDVLLEKYDTLTDKVMEHEYERRIAKKTFRNVIGRSFISGREACTLTGIFRKSANKINRLSAAAGLPEDDARRDQVSDTNGLGDQASRRG